jgi:hypothetical protein
VWATLVLSDNYFTDPDSYLHFGVARRIAEQGWVHTFEWLPHTTLHDPFPNMYIGQHLLLTPLSLLFDPELGLRLSILLLSSLSALSLHLVLRRNGVTFTAPWVVLGLLACPVALSYSVFLKGATTFLILLPWFIDAVWRSHEPANLTNWRRFLHGPWRVYLLAWLSVYVYVGATVLLGFVVTHLIVARIWNGRWDLRPLAATLLGLLTGMLLNPSWPAHWEYVARELLTVFNRDPNLVPGEFRGAEWAILTTDMLVRLVGPALLVWAAFLLTNLRLGARLDARSVSGAIAALGLLFLGLLSGTKLIQLFVFVSVLTLPLIAGHLTSTLRTDPQLRLSPRGFHLVTALALAFGIGASAVSYSTLRTELAEPYVARPPDYRDLAEWVVERTGPREMVVAPWDVMPGLFLFGTDQHFMAGYNVQFLRDQDEQRFNAYVFFQRGQVADPEATMVRFFDGARFVIVHRTPRSAGEAALTERLAERRTHFVELASPSNLWRIFRRLPTAGEGLP